MNDKRFVPLALTSVAIVLAVLVTLVLSPVTFAKNGGKGKITWSENPVRAEVAPGQIYNATVAFTASKDLANVTLGATPSLSGTVVLSPTTFAVVTAGVPYSVEVAFTAPTSGDRVQYNGIVHLRTGHKNHPANLKLRFAVPALAPAPSATR